MNEKIKFQDQFVATLIKGKPSLQNPRCPKCNCTLDQLSENIYKCRVQGCCFEFAIEST
jgi:uncharacterized protein with PIN domain